MECREFVFPSVFIRQKKNASRSFRRQIMKVFMSGYFAAAAKMVLLAAATLAFSASAFAQAQATAADLSGTVVDQTGAVVAGATVHAKGIATGISRTATTDGQGNYQMIGLPPGEYEIWTEG